MTNSIWKPKKLVYTNEYRIDYIAHYREYMHMLIEKEFKGKRLVGDTK